MLEIRKRTAKTSLAGNLQPNEPRLGRRDSIAFPDPKRPVLLQTHPGSLRSGSDHDWYALDSKTDDGLGIAPEPGVALGRDRICFLFTMSDRFQACPNRPGARHPSAPSRSTQPSSKIVTSRRALQLSRVVADPQTSKLHRTALRRKPRTSGGARRDRTDDLMLAKHALSQLSYGPSLFEERTSHKLGRASRLARLRPVRCLTTECGGPGRTRTSDLTLIKRAL